MTSERQPSRKPPNAPLHLEVGRLNDVVFSAVIRKVGQYPPFRQYWLGLMVDVLMDQLRHGGNVIGVREGKLVAYGGWIRVRRQDAEAWRAGRREIPPPAWEAGDAAISTIIIADDPGDLPALLRAISKACAGLPVYRMRAFTDGRPDRKRRPITGRVRESRDGA